MLAVWGMVGVYESGVYGEVFIVMHKFVYRSDGRMVGRLDGHRAEMKGSEHKQCVV